MGHNAVIILSVQFKCLLFSNYGKRRTLIKKLIQSWLLRFCTARGPDSGFGRSGPTKLGACKQTYANTSNCRD